MDITPTPRAADLANRVLAFMDEHIYPIEEAFEQAIVDSGDPLHIPPVLDELKAVAKADGLWNLFLPDEKFGPGLTNVEYAPLAEIMGRVWWASEVFNCSAPDTGNMEILAEFGTPEQQDRWLQPLLEGEIRSCFAMTEPDVASSDARNIEARIERDGDEYVINGRKWWTSNAINPRAEVAIFMGITNPDAPVYQRQSQVLVPMDTPGVEVVRPMLVFGFDDGYAGHPEVTFTDVRVPVSNLIGAEGAGFAIAQARLGPGRIHHCMRMIGAAERGLELMCRRALAREAFGGPLSDQGVIQDWIAESRVRIEQARLLTMKTAWMMDTVGKKAARIEISAIKVAAVDAANYVLDRAIQAHGAAGLSQDTPLARLWAYARTLRFADGPDEVHKRSIARRELRKYQDR
jgi:acyl-CoA dehydrogenase